MLLLHLEDLEDCCSLTCTTPEMAMSTLTRPCWRRDMLENQMSDRVLVLRFKRLHHPSKAGVQLLRTGGFSFRVKDTFTVIFFSSACWLQFKYIFTSLSFWIHRAVCFCSLDYFVRKKVFARFLLFYDGPLC